ncbi:MAG: exodeoxyribonuclease VII large subunit [Anaerolineaceae bacterium]|nr:exodeoxyribonuclease VII large subunit [Anaerolineaceae bacterium]
MMETQHKVERTIPETNALVKSLVEQETIGFPFWIQGIVGRRFLSDRGHEYFDLSDDDYSINCFLPEKVRGTLNFTLTNGLEVKVLGTIRVFERQAKVQIEVAQAQLVEHTPFSLDENVRKQLEDKGLWPKQPRPLPTKISKIGLVTSKNSEARHDFEQTYRQEFASAMPAITLRDVRLQGEQAPRQIADAIKELNGAVDKVDVIVVTRGGGRAHDLNIFNNIQVAEAICQSEIPVVTGIGHQRDVTFADLVADNSTFTPTAAALALVNAQKSEMPPLDAQKKSKIPCGLLAAAVLVILVLIVFLIALV